MFGAVEREGVTLPQLFATKGELGNSEDITLSGSKPQQVKTYNSNRSVMLPQISQKTHRPIPKTIHRVALNTDQSSMLEALEIYKKSRILHSPDEREVRSTAFQSVPCPTPIDPLHDVIPHAKTIKVPPNKQPTCTPERLTRKKSAEKILNVIRQPTFSKQLPVSTTLQKRLEKLAKHKSITSKRNQQQQSVRVSIRSDTNPKVAIRNGNISLPTLKGESSTKHMHYSFNSTLLPKIKENPRKAGLSYQLLEIPVKVIKPERKRIMFTHTHYDAYQHAKFSSLNDKKLSIVGGPESKLNTAVWDYNKFLYLNVKI